MTLLSNLVILFILLIKKKEEQNTNEKYINSFLSAKEVEGCSARTIKYYRENIENLIAKLDKPIKIVTTEDIRKYLSDYKESNKCSSVTIDNLRRIFSSFFSWLEDEDYIAQVVEESLKSAAIWDEVKDKLDKSAMGLSGGQQQRLCIARTIAVSPEVILMDEPCSALDPISTLKIENLIHKLKEKYTIVMVTHNMQQATRVSKYTSFFLNGEIIESGLTDQIFVNPKEQKTEEYITGRFG